MPKQELTGEDIQDDILERLRTRPRRITLRDVSRGTGVSESYLAKLLSGEIKEPSLVKAWRIYNFLRNHDDD